jgi:AraC-like DNA-binding protein
MSIEPPRQPLHYAEFAPPSHLRDYVSCFWRSHTLDHPRQTTILPDGCIDLIWQEGKEPFIAGPMTVPVSTTTRPGVVTLGVRFKPGAAAALLRVSAAELRDLSVPLEELWPRAHQQRTSSMGLIIVNKPSVDDAIAAVSALLQNAVPPDQFIADACRWFAQRPGEPASVFIAGSGMSERQARRRFQEHVGYGPKTLQRILRMQRVLWLLGGPRAPHTLALLAQAAGFADQAHLTREMRALTAQLPTMLVMSDPRSAVADLFKTSPA